MLKITIPTAFLLLIMIGFKDGQAQISTHQTRNNMNTTAEKSSIEKLIFSYSDAFNTGDLAKTVAVYAEDGILMPQGAPLAQGPEQLKATFGFLFKTFQIRIDYVVDEVIVSGDHAYARTNSKVKTVVRANGETIELDNKELFVLRKIDGQWKISHYIFNNTTKLK
jgi:uncharacterized protein (TIGR02246 family)